MKFEIGQVWITGDGSIVKITEIGYHNTYWPISASVIKANNEYFRRSNLYFIYTWDLLGRFSHDDDVNDVCFLKRKVLKKDNPEYYL